MTRLVILFSDTHAHHTQLIHIERRIEIDLKERNKSLLFSFADQGRMAIGEREQETNNFDTSVLTDNERCPLLRSTIQMIMNLDEKK